MRLSIFSNMYTAEMCLTSIIMHRSQIFGRNFDAQSNIGIALEKFATIFCKGFELFVIIICYKLRKNRNLWNRVTTWPNSCSVLKAPALKWCQLCCTWVFSFYSVLWELGVVTADQEALLYTRNYL
jgi:hypothetical protein